MQRLALILALAFGGSAATASGQQATTGQRPQEPKPPFPYRSIEVQYANPAAPGVTLAATLTLPPGKGGSPEHSWSAAPGNLPAISRFWATG